MRSSNISHNQQNLKNYVHVETMDFLALTLPIDDISPSGENLEYSEEFLKIKDFLDTSSDKKPNWNAAYDISMVLFKKTRDLRLASIISQCLLEIDGLLSLKNSLVFIENLLVNLWDSIYPELENNDIAYRLKALHEINDNEYILYQIRQTAFLPQSNTEPITIRDIEKMDEGHPTGTLKLEQLQQHIQTQQEEALTLAASLQSSLMCCQRIEQHLPQSTNNLQKLLAMVLKYLPKVEENTEQAEAPRQAPPSPESSPTRATPLRQEVKTIQHRSDIALLLDQMCEYLAEHEPSNPAPLLLRRAKKLLELNFLEVMEELNPEGVEQIKRLAGLNRST
jgi:type VI secretion system protein ImpA